MRAQELQTYLHEHIPLSRAMEASVLTLDPDGVTLGAPLAPNINHRATVFGGSASALAILAAWSLLHTRLRDQGLSATLVIQRNSMEYEKPIAGAFTARSALADPDDWPRFVNMLARKGRARIAVTAQLRCEGVAAGRLMGEFVALTG
ncbi:YiiD C-terminal domain-containing protein [Chromobacterium alticapitis]|uniref:Thioesterase n=1 Tax=Chromobacterium alticapitis TaxID=2073169 RepID=A0A2S5DKM1_9NEIS|nr:YiiD C-terminal domain-containing protein [Chromobacterium alticapitis]POZ63528.1 thioesterase [Chromobacterium alticapitis]